MIPPRPQGEGRAAAAMAGGAEFDLAREPRPPWPHCSAPLMAETGGGGFANPPYEPEPMAMEHRDPVLIGSHTKALAARRIPLGGGAGGTVGLRWTAAPLMTAWPPRASAGAQVWSWTGNPFHRAPRARKPASSAALRAGGLPGIVQFLDGDCTWFAVAGVGAGPAGRGARAGAGHRAGARRSTR